MRDLNLKLVSVDNVEVNAKFVNMPFKDRVKLAYGFLFCGTVIVEKLNLKDKENTRHA